MKKSFMTIVLVLLFLLSSFIYIIFYLKNNYQNIHKFIKWDRIAFDLYVNKHSIHNQGKHKTGIFKIEIDEKYSPYKIKNKNINYAIVEYSVLCDDIKSLKTTNALLYDKYNKKIKYKANKYDYQKFDKVYDSDFIYSTICDVIKYDKFETITFKEYLNFYKTSSDILAINQNGDVIYNGKVVLTNSGLPLSDRTAYSDIELKILFKAEDIKPREGCNPNDYKNNGTLGCYIDIPHDN